MNDTPSSMRRRASSALDDDPTAFAVRHGEERPEDIVELLNQSKPAFTAAVLRCLPEATAVGVLDQPQLEHGAAIVSSLPSDEAARLLDQMSADRAVDVIRELRVSVRNDLLARVGAETKAATDRLLRYPGNCAGGIMTTEFVAVPADWTVEQVLAHVRAVEHARETVYAIYLLDAHDGTLRAAVPLRRLVAADPEALVLAAAPAGKVVMVAPDTPVDETVRLISKYNLLAIPVVDSQRHVVGIVTVDDAIDMLVAGQNAEVQHLGGMEPLEASYTRVGLLV